MKPTVDPGTRGLEAESLYGKDMGSDIEPMISECTINGNRVVRRFFPAGPTLLVELP